MAVSIDKLDFVLHEHIQISEMGERLRGTGLTLETDKLSSKGLLSLGPGDYGVELQLYKYDSSSIKTIKTNPSKSPSLVAYHARCRQVLTRNEFECALVYRVDPAVDLDLPFDTVCSSAIAKFKQTSRPHYRSGKLTGLYIGNSPEEILIYDRGAKLKDDSLIETRIEVRLTGEKKPINHPHEVSRLVELGRDGYPFRPFKNITLLDFDFVPYDSFSCNDDAYKAGHFRGWFEAVGYQLAKKHFNSHGNFNRDFNGKFFHISPYQIDLNLKFQAALSKFFSGWDNKYLFWSSNALRTLIDWEPSEKTGDNPSRWVTDLSKIKKWKDDYSDAANTP